MKLPTAIAMVAVVVFSAACSRAPERPRPSGPTKPVTPAATVSWVNVQTPADVEAALGAAQADQRPVFLFWTASWCPPCNHVKSTIFTREEFVAQSRSFVAVNVDGDTPGGQALGKRFNVSGYPTMVLLAPPGNEITRLEGSIEPAKYLQLLDHGLKGGASARQSLDAALTGKPVDADGWRMLAYYSWGTDEQQLVPSNKVASTLLRLARACPPEQREAASRLVLQALSAAAGAKDEGTVIDKADARASVTSVLAQPELVREHYDLVAFSADAIAGAITEAGSPQRAELVGAWTSALDRLAHDKTLNNAGRVWTTNGKVALARLDNKEGALAAPLLAEVRSLAERVDRETSDLNERQSVIYSAGSMLARAGLLDESDALLTRELKRSHSPYYYMLVLASNAKKRDTPAGNAAAIDWARQGYETSVGPATRLEWGGAYVRYLVDLAPHDASQIEKAADKVIGELRASSGAFSGRSKRSLERMSGRLTTWNESGEHDPVLARLNARLTPICSQAAADAGDRTVCEKLFQPKSV